MKFCAFVRILFTALLFAVTSQVDAAATLIVNDGGVLVGAHDVNVGGTMYDVRFSAGSCNSLFNGCSTSAFAFTSESAAGGASFALIDQVFNNPLAYSYGIDPSKILGCTYKYYCYLFIPFATTGNIFSVEDVLYFGNGSASYSLYSNVFLTSADTTIFSTYTFAIFEPANPAAGVPEPSSIALISLAFSGFAFIRRRKA